MSDKLLSIILQSYNSEDKLVQAVQAISDCMEGERIPFEIIIIDDGSIDRSFEIAEQLESKHDMVWAYQLSKNYTPTYGVFAGFSVCNGACATFLPDDLQSPLHLVVSMYRKWESGHKLVVGNRKSRDDGFISDLFSNLYYKMMNSFSEVNFPKGGTDVWLADREILDILIHRIHPINTSINIEILRLGFDPLFIPFERGKRKEKSRWTVRKKLRLAMDTFFASSSLPIKLISLLGFTMFFASLVIIPFMIFAKLFTENRLFGLTIPGWTTMVIITMAFNGLILFSLGIVAEYIWRIYEEVKDRPGYIIKQKKKDGE